MKSIRFLRHVISLLLLAIVFPLMACGPFYSLIPTPDFFGISGSSGHTADFERQDNLLLWQKLTSTGIPLADIEQAVYRDSYERFAVKLECRSLRGDNLFYTYITNTGDEEISDLLLVAKELEERRNELTSPWYYPSERRSCDDTDLFSNIQERIESYRGYRLKDRYALQMVRLLFASRRYSECATFTDSVFSAFPDDNLMKRMACKYEAGCWKRMGCSERADTVFAKSGDIWSISISDRIPLMVSLNPGAPQLVEYVRQNAADTLFMLEIDKIAPGVLTDRRVKNKGDWYFALAYIADTYKNNISDSRRFIYKAMHEKFSSPEVNSLARTYKMKIDARRGDMMSLHSDLAWLEAKTSPLNPEADKWIRLL